jgi:putative peptidoglycan lipid II flippase
VSKSLKNISVVASATMVSRVLGLVREMLTAAVFGTSALASAYATAFQLPNLFRRLLAEGGMTAAFVPTLNEELEQRQRPGAFRLVNQVSSWLLVVTGVLVVLAMVVLSQQSWIAGIGHQFGADDATINRWLLAAKLAVVLFPYLVFVCLAAAFSAALQTLNRFLEPALSPIWLNVAMIGLLFTGTYLGGTDVVKMNWFCGGVLLGGFLQMAVPAWALTREGWRPQFDLNRSEPVRAVVRLMGPTVLGSAVYLINMTVSRFVGLSLNDATVSVLNYAQRLMELPIGVFAVAVSTVVFPLISRYAARGDMDQLGVAYRKGMRLILMINIPAAVGLALLAEPVIRLFFQHGKFHAADTQLMMPVLMVYALGLPFFSFVNLVLRAFYAQKDTATPVRAALLSFIVNLGLSIALMGPLSTVGLAIAGNVAIIAQAWYLQVKLARKTPQLAVHHLFGDLGKIAIASTVMGLVVAAGWCTTTHYFPQTKLTDGCAVAALVVAGVSVYGGLLWLLRIEGREELGALIARFRGRRNAGEAVLK